MEQVLTKYLEYLLTQIVIDMEKFNQPWMWWWICIPAFVWMILIVLKYCLLTLPIWLPLRLVITSFTNLIVFKKEKNDKNN